MPTIIAPDELRAWTSAQRFARGLHAAADAGAIADALATTARELLGVETAYVATRGPGGLSIAARAGAVAGLPPVGAVLEDGAGSGALTGGAIVPLDRHGVLVLVDRHPLGADALALAVELAAGASAALARVQALDDKGDLTARTQALLAVQRALAGGLLDDVFSAFGARLHDELAFDLAWIGGFPAAQPGRTASSEALSIRAVYPGGVAGAPLPMSTLALTDPALGPVLRSAQARSAGPVFVDDARASALAPWATSAALVPLVAHDAVIGALVLLARRPLAHAASSGLDARWLLAAIAEPLAMALQNASLFDELRTTTREWERTFDVMDALVFLADEHGRVRRANWALARRLGLSPSKVIGLDAASLFPGQPLPMPKPNAPGPLRASIVGPRGEPLRASAVSLAEGGFVVVLHDAQVATGTRQASYAALRRIATGSGRRGRVLIVDDEPSILRAVSRTIARSHEITTATDGDEALARIREVGGEFDAVVTDVQMARIGGVDLYRAIEREYPRLAERFVFMTGGVFQADTEQFLRGLGARVLRKPFDPEFLRRAIDERVALSPVA